MVEVIQTKAENKYLCVKHGIMKTISLKVTNRTADAILSMSKADLNDLTKKVENWATIKALQKGQIDIDNDNVKEEDKQSLLEIMDKMSAEAERRGLTPEILADILEIDMDEMNRTLGIEE